MYQQIKLRTHRIMETAAQGDRASRLFDIFILTLIALNVLAVMLETVDSLDARYDRWFEAFDKFSIVVFTIEYLLRLWSCTADKRFHDPLTGRLRFIFSPMALVDLFAILPFYIPLVLPVDLRILRILRLVRIVRLFKLSRYSTSLATLGFVLRNKKEELWMTLFVCMLLLVMSSSLMYAFEHDNQPEAFSNVFAAMWWGITTLTTVGYGDIRPITVAGKILGALVSILGIAMFAMPTAIIGSGFVDELARRKRPKRHPVCPHCGKPLE